jgi:hypothetical protein
MEKQIDSCLHFVFVFRQWKNKLIHVCIWYWYLGNGKTFLFSNETEFVVLNAHIFPSNETEIVVLIAYIFAFG